MTRVSNKALVGVALVLSVATSGMIYNFLQSRTAVKPIAQATVVVAKTNIPSRTKITADMVQEVSMPQEYIQPGAMREASAVVGVAVRDSIVAGEQVLDRRLLTGVKAGSFSGTIPPGKRAVSVGITEVSGVAGLMKPGDYVDVMAIFDQSTAGENVGRMILQNIQVLAVDRELEDGHAGAPEKKDAVKTQTVTLAVSPEQAAQLALSDEKAKVRLALRPFLPDGVLPVTAAVTPADLVGTYSKDSSTKNEERAVPAPAQPQQPSPQFGRGIQLIRGTKAETIPVD